MKTNRNPSPGEAIDYSLAIHRRVARCQRPPLLQRTGAFSLLEMMVAVTLLLIIISALLTMFYQTQRAFRLSKTQVDVLESGRAAMEQIPAELSELAPSYRDGQINLYAALSFPPLVQPRPGSALARTNVIQDIFFLRQHNDQWIGTGYFVSPTNYPIGTLYRFEETVYTTNTYAINSALIGNLFTHFATALQTNPPSPFNCHRIMDGVVNLKLVPYDQTGNIFPRPWYEDAPFYSFPNSFTNAFLPAFLDLELGIFDPRAFEHWRALNDVAPPRAQTYLEDHVEKVQLFRQRIPVRSSTTTWIFP